MSFALPKAKLLFLCVKDCRALLVPDQPPIDEVLNQVCKKVADLPKIEVGHVVGGPEAADVQAGPAVGWP